MDFFEDKAITIECVGLFIRNIQADHLPTMATSTLTVGVTLERRRTSVVVKASSSQDLSGLELLQMNSKDLRPNLDSSDFF